VLATPVETHAALALQALEAGKHVFVEKPLATSSADAARVAAARGDRVLFVGHVLLYHPLFGRLRGERWQQARMSWRKVGTFGADLLWNLASHHVSLAIALAGAPPDDAELLSAEGVVTTCDRAVVRLRFGAREVLIDLDRAGAPRAHVISAGRLVWADDALYELRGERLELVAEAGDALGAELDAFRAAVEDGAPFPSDAAHALAVVETIERIRR
jgi:predicted dehydrogenase